MSSKFKLVLALFLFCVAARPQSPGITTVAVTGTTPQLVANAGVTIFVWTLSANVTSSTFSSPAVGVGAVKLCEDGTGGWSVVFPPNFVNFKALASTALNTCQYYWWEYDGTNVIAINDAGTAVTANTRTLNFNFNAGTAAVATGNTAAIVIPFSCTIAGYSISVQATDTATFKLWRKASGTAIPTVADSINTSGVSISTGTSVHSTTISDFTSTTIAANDVVIGQLSAVGGVATWVSVQIPCTVN